MKKSFSKPALVALFIVALVALVACPNGGSNSGGSAGSISLATVANILGTWLTAGRADTFRIDSFTITRSSDPSSARISVTRSDAGCQSCVCNDGFPIGNCNAICRDTMAPPTVCAVPNSSTDTGFLDFTNDNTTTRGIRLRLSTGTMLGTLSLFNDCRTMDLTLEGERSRFSQAGNVCTDTPPSP